jgi:hypothetical protein
MGLKVEGSDLHIRSNHLGGHQQSLLLVLFDHDLQDLDELLLHLAGEHRAALVVAADLRQALVVLHEEPQPLARHVHVHIGTQLALQISTRTTTLTKALKNKQ